MTIDQATLVSDRWTTEWSYGPDDVILYHLGLGAGLDPLSGVELPYVLESALKVLPTFSVLAASDPVFQVLGSRGLSGVDHSLQLHGEQSLVVHRPLPIAAKVTNQARVRGVSDKRTGALVVIDVDTSDDDGPLTTNTFALYFREAHTMAGDPNPSAGPGELTTPPPQGIADRPPDFVGEVATFPQQALLYRLSGDKNLIHADPEYARSAGFERPILHGLCFWGAICKCLTDGLAAGDVSVVRRWSARFRNSMYPGERLVVKAWKVGPGEYAVTAEEHESGRVVLTNGTFHTVESQ